MPSKKITDIDGIGPAYAVKLKFAGIRSVRGLLEKCADPSGRNALAQVTGIDDRLLLKWANMADLYRVKGIGSEYAELLERAGVDTVKELRNRVAGNLLEKLVAVNNETKLVRRLPSPKRVERFIEEAKRLDPVITH